MKILIIQQKMIGDVLTTSILFEVIKHKYPNSELHYVINTHTYPVVENNPFIDYIHFFTPEHKNSKRKLWEFAKQLKQEKFDCVIDVYSKFSSNIISYLSKADIKISKHKWYSSFLYSHTFKDSNQSKSNAGLAIQNRLQLLKPLDIDFLKTVRPKIYLTETEKDVAKTFLESNSINLSQPLFMIGVLGSASNKTYPFNYMAKVINTIVIKKPNCQILFNYIPKQKAEAKAIFDLCHPNTQSHIFFNVYGKSLRDFLAITWHCNALIGNEGGAINMAKAMFKPTFTIFSPWIKKEAWNMFDDGKTHVSVHLKDYDKTAYQNIKAPKELKAKAIKFYMRFKPRTFKTEFTAFLNRF